MAGIDRIKNGITELYKKNSIIHISVKLTRPRVLVEDAPVKIIGVYRNIFQVEEIEGDGALSRHTFQYGDVLIGQVMIEELSCILGGEVVS